VARKKKPEPKRGKKLALPATEAGASVGRRPFLKLLGVLSVAAAGVTVAGWNLRDLLRGASEQENLEDLQQHADRFAEVYLEALKSADAGVFISSRNIAVVMHAIDRAMHSIKVVGINALGPLHQGREKLLEVLDRGGQVSVGVMNPFRDTFAQRQREEGQVLRSGRLSTRLAMEWIASFGILRDLELFRDGGQLDAWTYDEYPHGSIVIVDEELAQYNPYRGERAETGGKKAQVGRGVTHPLQLFTRETALGQVQRLCQEFDRLRNRGVRLDLSNAGVALEVMQARAMEDFEE
jgi:hypothetical protein